MVSKEYRRTCPADVYSTIPFPGNNSEERYMTDNNYFIEQKIIRAVQELLTGKVNEFLMKSQFTVPLIEFGDFSLYEYAVSPAIFLSACEQTEQEKIIFTFHKTRQSELYFNAYSRAIRKAVNDNPALSDAAKSAEITESNYIPPETSCDSESWDLIVTLRVTC